MKLFLASVIEHYNQIEESIMKLYLAGEHSVKNGSSCLRDWKDLYILESYYYARKNKYFEKLYSKGCDLLLDSGAFSFMMNSNIKEADWDRYIEEYAAFINRYGIEKFLELDIESVVGMQEVERLRTKLETLTGRKCIPVWHVGRGIEYFRTMCRDYEYVAFGGLMSDGYSRKQLEKTFPWFIKTAHDNNAKIHALGWTPTDCDMFRKYPFDSCDSTAWVCGNQFGTVYRFDYSTGVMQKYQKKQGQRVRHKETAENNFYEWVKYQQYIKRITNE